MQNSILVYEKLLSIIREEYEGFTTLVDVDNALGLNVTTEEIINFLEFSSNDTVINSPLVGSIIITKGDILSILKIIAIVTKYTGEYTIFINNDNVGTNSYLCKRANTIFESMNLNITLNLDYSNNYNRYTNELVNIVGSEEFIQECSKDFPNSNQIIV